MDTPAPCHLLAAVAGAALLLLSWATAIGGELESIAPPAGRVPTIHLGPRHLDAAEQGIGRTVPRMRVTTIDGIEADLFETGAAHGTVVVVRDPACPVSQRYTARITTIARRYAGNFDFVFTYPATDTGDADRTADRATIGATGIFVSRGSLELAATLGVNSTGDTFVIDRDGRLRFRGAIDDQYGIGYTRDAATRHYLRNALDALRSGESPRVPATSAPGCYIDADPDHAPPVAPVPGDHLLS